MVLGRVKNFIVFVIFKRRIILHVKIMNFFLKC